MFRTVLAHLRAQWIGVLALLIALGTGSAYAANTVFSEDIVNGQVKAVDIGTGQVQSADVKNEGLTQDDLGSNSVDATEVADDSIDGGELVDDGVRQADIALGAVGPDELADFTVAQDLRVDLKTSPSNTTLVKSTQAFCTGGQGHVTGGGHLIFGSQGTVPNVAIRESMPVGVNSWVVTAAAPAGSPAWSLRVFVVCAR
jgi:hypothetical protein